MVIAVSFHCKEAPAKVLSVSSRSANTPAMAPSAPPRHGGLRKKDRPCAAMGPGRASRGAWQRCPWAVAGPGRGSRRRAERSSQRGRRAGGPPPTGAPSSPAPQQDQTAPGTPARPTGTPSSPTHGHQPTDTHQTSTPEATESGPEATENTPEATESGPEPLGSGPPSMLSDYRRYATGDHRCATAVRCQ